MFHSGILSIPEDLKLLKMALKVMLAVCVGRGGGLKITEFSQPSLLRLYSEKR